MPVKKFRSVDDMPDVRPRCPLDPDNLRVACELSELAFALHPWRFEPGVRKFKSVDDAWTHRKAWQKRNLRPRSF